MGSCSLPFEMTHVCILNSTGCLRKINFRLLKKIDLRVRLCRRDWDFRICGVCDLQGKYLVFKFVSSGEIYDDTQFSICCLASRPAIILLSCMDVCEVHKRILYAATQLLQRLFIANPFMVVSDSNSFI